MLQQYGNYLNTFATSICLSDTFRSCHILLNVINSRYTGKIKFQNKRQTISDRNTQGKIIFFYLRKVQIAVRHIFVTQLANVWTYDLFEQTDGSTFSRSSDGRRREFCWVSFEASWVVIADAACLILERTKAITCVAKRISWGLFNEIRVLSVVTLFYGFGLHPRSRVRLIAPGNSNWWSVTITRTVCSVQFNTRADPACNARRPAFCYIRGNVSAHSAPFWFMTVAVRIWLSPRVSPIPTLARADFTPVTPTRQIFCNGNPRFQSDIFPR